MEEELNITFTIIACTFKVGSYKARYVMLTVMIFARFPDKNAQIKVHKLVVNACTEFFLNAGLCGEGVMLF